MAYRKKKPNNEDDPLDFLEILSDSDKQAILKQLMEENNQKLSLAEIPKLKIPEDLNILYEDHIESIRKCFIYLDRFTGKDEEITKLMKVFWNHPKKFSRDLDLNEIAELADLSKESFRKLIWFALEKLGGEQADLILLKTKPALLEKTAQLALTVDHPDSEHARDTLLEYYGYKSLPKNSNPAVNVSINNNSQVAVANGLPSFTDSIKETSAITSKLMNEIIDSPKQLEAPKNVIDLDLFKEEKKEKQENG